MSVLLSAKNNFDLSNGELPSISADQLVDYSSVTSAVASSPISSSQLLAAQRLLRVSSSSPNQSAHTSLSSPPPAANASSPGQASPDHHLQTSYSDQHSPLSTSSSLHNIHPVRTNSHLHHFSARRSRPNSQSIDQPTPEDSSNSSEHFATTSRSNSPANAKNDHTSSSNPPTQLVAMASELLDQLKTLNGCTSPNRLTTTSSFASSPSSAFVSIKSSAAANAAQTTTVTAASSPVAPSPCVTFNLCNGQMQLQQSSSSACTSLPSITDSIKPLIAVSNLKSMDYLTGEKLKQRRLYQIDTLQSGIHSGEFLSLLAEMRRSNQLLDCCLFCEQQQLRAHKLVLAACSPFFRAMFAGISGCSNSTVVIPDVPLIDLHLLIRIAYGELLGSFQLSDRRLLSLWQSAKRLQMRSVCQFMLKNRLLETQLRIASVDNLSESEFESLPAFPVSLSENANLLNPEISTDEDDAMLYEQLEQLDSRHTRSLVSDSPASQSDDHSSNQNLNTTNHSSPDRDCESPLGSSTNTEQSHSAITSGSIANSTSTASTSANSGPGEELNVISAIAALSQAAAAAVAANKNTSAVSNHRKRYASMDVSATMRNSDQPMDLACSRDIDVESDNSNNGNQLLRQMQEAIAARSQSFSMRTQKSQSIGNTEAFLSHMALNNGSLSPTARALFLATAGLDLQSVPPQANVNTSSASQLSPVIPNDLSTNAQLMAAAQQQLFGQLSGLTGIGVNGNSNISQINNPLQPVKRGRGRPPRHTQPRDLDDDSTTKDHAHSPPQAESAELSAEKRWKPSVDNILKMKSRNKLMSSNVATLPLSNTTPAHKSITSNSSSMSSQSNASPFDRTTSNSCAVNLCNNSSSAAQSNSSPLNLNTTNAMLNAKSLMSKLPNDRNANNSADNKNVCPFCPQIYYSTQAMNDHINNVHTKTSAKYVCNICSKEFSWKISLVKHQKTHTLGNTDSNALTHGSASDPISVPISVAMNSSQPLLAHQLNQQMSREFSKQFGQSSLSACNGLSAHQILSNGDLFKNLISQRDSLDMPAIKFD